MPLITIGAVAAGALAAEFDAPEFVNVTTPVALDINRTGATRPLVVVDDAAGDTCAVRNGALAALFGVGIADDESVGVSVVPLAATFGVGNVVAVVAELVVLVSATVPGTVPGGGTNVFASRPFVMYALASELIEPLIVLSGFAVNDGGMNCPVCIASGGVR